MRPPLRVLGKSVRVPFTIESSLPRDYVTTVVLRTSNGDEVSKEVRIAAMGVTHDWLAWKPAALGDVTLTLTVPPHHDETLKDNNRMSVPVSVRQEKLRVLVVESYPRWEYRYLRNALSRDPGIELSCLLFHPGLSKPGGGNKDYIRQFPAGLDELSRFDVVFLGDVGVGNGQLTDEQCGWLKGLVEHQASGIVFMPGTHGLAALAAKDRAGRSLPGRARRRQAGRLGIEHALPFRPHGPRPAQPPDQAGRQRGREHGSLGRTARLPVVRPGSAGTARRAKCWPCTRTARTSSVECRCWRPAPTAPERSSSWGPTARGGGVEGSKTSTTIASGARSCAGWPISAIWPKEKRCGSTTRPISRKSTVRLTLNANVMNRSGEPLQGGDVTARITAPSGKAESIGFVSSGDAWGAYSAQFTAREPGRHQVVLTCKQTGAALEASFFVQGDASERVGRPARPEVLEEIARVTRGKVMRVDRPDEIVSSLASLPDPAPSVRRVQVWSHPLTAGVVIALMGVFWIGRKVIGLI